MKTQTKDLSLAWQICLMVCLSAVIVTMPDFAFALTPTATDTRMGNVLCGVTGWFIGNTGKGLATIAITGCSATASVTVFVDNLSDGDGAQPYAEPRPVVKQIMFAPPATCPVADTGSYPGVSMYTKPFAVTGSA